MRWGLFVLGAVSRGYEEVPPVIHCIELITEDGETLVLRRLWPTGLTNHQDDDMSKDGGVSLTARDYWMENYPDAYETLEDPEGTMAEDTALAAAVAAELGQSPTVVPGENLPAYDICVWATLYARYA